jgi:putative chitinase
MIIKPEKLALILPTNKYIDEWCSSLNDFLPNYEIDGLERVSAFISQCAHESGNFAFLKENLNYRWESLRRVFPKYFPNDELAKKYAHNQQAIASRVYANRMGNGDEASGDGWKYCGRGLIQLTGYNNYKKFADYVELDVDDLPEYLTTFDGAIHSACWFWEINNLNKFADSNDLRGLTRAINGGYNGLEDRISKYEKTYKILFS